MTSRWGRARVVVRMTRPLQVALVLIVTLLGVAVARARGAEHDPTSLLVGMGVLVAVAASIHLVNEYADHETDARTIRTPFSGGSGALEASEVSRGVALRAAIASAGIGASGGLVAWAFDLLPGPALVIVLVGLAGGWAYSVGPRPLAWHGLGEVANACLGGMLLPLYGVALAGGAIDALAVIAFAPLTLVVVMNLLATTWPDRRADASVGKRTLATRWSVLRLRRAYTLVASMAVIALVLTLALGHQPTLATLAGLSVAPFLVWGHRAYTRVESPFPTVLAMSWLIGAQLAAWLAVG